MFGQLSIEAVSAQCGGVPDDNQFHACSCDCNVHSSQVAQEAYVAVGVVAYEAYYYDITLLTLEAVDGADADMAAQATEVVLQAQQASYEASLTAVGGYDTEVDAFVLDTEKKFYRTEGSYQTLVTYINGGLEEKSSDKKDE